MYTCFISVYIHFTIKLTRPFLTYVTEILNIYSKITGFQKKLPFSKVRVFQKYVFFKSTCFSRLRLFENYVFFKIMRFSKLRIFQNYVFFKITSFSKLRLFQNYVFFKITSFSKLRLFQNYVFFKITSFSKLRLFQNLAIFKITKRGGVDPLPLLIINMFFLVEQNSALVKNGLSNITNYKKWVGP